MKNLFKKFIASMLIILIVISMVEPYEVKALPAPTVPWVPVVIEGGKATASGAVAVTGGMTVGGALALSLGVVAVGAGVYLTVTNWDDITNALFEAPKVEATLTWWNDIASKAKYIYDDTRTLSMDITNGVEINLYDYVLPDGTNITIPKEVNDFMEEFIQDYYKYEQLAPGETSNFSYVINDFFNSYSILRENADWTFLDYNYCMLLSKNNAFDIYVSNNPLGIVKVSNGTQWGFFMQGTEIYKYKYSNKYFESKTLFASSGDAYSSSIGLGIGYTNSTTPRFDLITNLMLNSHPIVFSSGTTSFLVPSMVIRSTLPQTNFKWQEPNVSTYTYNTLKVNPQTIEQLKALDLQAVPDTDNLIGSVKQADINARNKGYEIFDKQMVTSTETVPDDVDPVPPPIEDPTKNEWYDVILNPLKAFAKWLFVPSDDFVAEFVAHCEQTMAEKTSWLSYPLTLVIEFLQKVSQLGVQDCIFHIPRMEIFGQVFYEGIDYNFTQEINKTDYAYAYSIYKSIVKYALIICLIGLAIKKGDEIIRGN